MQGRAATSWPGERRPVIPSALNEPLRSRGGDLLSGAHRPRVPPMLAHPIAVRRRLAPLDEAERRRHKLRNVVHSILLLGGIVALLALCGWVLFGPEGLVGMALGAAIALAFSPTISPGMVLRLYRAREIAPHDLPEVLHVLAALAERAGLARRPRLYYVPSSDAQRVRGRRARRCGDRGDRRHAARAQPARAERACWRTRSATSATATCG